MSRLAFPMDMTLTLFCFSASDLLELLRLDLYSLVYFYTVVRGLTIRVFLFVIQLVRLFYHSVSKG